MIVKPLLIGIIGGVIGSAIVVGSVFGYLIYEQSEYEQIQSEKIKQIQEEYNKELDAKIRSEKLSTSYRQVTGECNSNPLVYDTDSLLNCIYSKMALTGDETYIHIYKWWSTFPEFKDYKILYHDQSEKCYQFAINTLEECLDRADVFAKEQSGFSDEMLTLE